MPNTMAASPEDGLWESLPDHILLAAFQYLKGGSLLKASEVNKQWRRVALDEFLWKDLVYERWNINREIPRAPGKHSWLGEYKRLYYHTPYYETEVLKDHRDQVLHVSFSHNGKYFATSSKDGHVKVWTMGFPCVLKYYEDMKAYTWKYTQYTQFNSSDTLLLVSGVHFGSHSTSGEIAVFNVTDGFQLECRIQNKPYDIFGTWYNANHLLSGNLYWLGNFSSCSVLWLNKADQAVESEWENVVMRLFKFRNINASSIRTIIIADIAKAEETVISESKEQAMFSSSSSDSSLASFRKRKVSELEASAPQNQMPSNNKELRMNSDISFTGDSTSSQMSINPFAKDTPKSLGQQSDNNIQVPNSDVKSETPSTESSVEILSTGTYDLQLCDECNLRGTNSQTTTSSTDVAASSQNVANSSGKDGGASSCSFGSNTQESSSSKQSLRTIESDKYLIFTTGSKTYTPHQIGIKRIKDESAVGRMEKLAKQRERYQLKILKRRAEASKRSSEGEANARDESHQQVDENHGDDEIDIHEIDDNDVPPPPPGNQDGDFDEDDDEDVDEDDEAMKMDDIDHLIEMNGHIIGMCLSPDHRYLYVNARSWPDSYVIENPLEPPPIAQEIEIHVIDLLTMEDKGVMHHAHKAYTPNDECFFIFLDVCEGFVASGAENKQGYLWDRHYRSLLTAFSHQDVVNSVAFHPNDSETLVTVSDDNKIKVWRSRNRCHELGIEIPEDFAPMLNLPKPVSQVEAVSNGNVNDGQNDNAGNNPDQGQDHGGDNNAAQGGDDNGDNNCEDNGDNDFDNQGDNNDAN